MSDHIRPHKNLQRAIDRVHQASARGAQIVCLPNCSRPSISASVRTPACSIWPQPIPGPVTVARLAALAKQLRIVLIASLFEKRAPGVYHNTATVIDAGWISTRAIPQDAHSGRSALLSKSITSLRVISVTRLLTPPLGVLARWCAGTSGIQKERALPRLQGAELLFYPTAIGWHPVEKAQIRDRPARCLAHHSTCACHRQRSVRGGGESSGLRNRRPSEATTSGDGLEFWERHSVCGRSLSDE